MDRMIMERMEFYGYHGVFPEENKLGQRYYADVTLYMDLRNAGVSDNLGETVNYAHIYKSVKEIVEGKPFKLIEAVAENIAMKLLDNYTDIIEITVKVTKPHPPFDVHFAGVAVEIHRKRV